MVRILWMCDNCGTEFDEPIVTIVQYLAPDHTPLFGDFCPNCNHSAIHKTGI